MVSGSPHPPIFMPPTNTVAAAAQDRAHASDAQPSTACENCQTSLQGHYCHHCGQSAHNPLKHVGHAVEEVFESFWHLDGRIFRTLRELLVPGRVALNYLRGHRVRYVQPLRLFVILTLFTFFVGKLTVHMEDMQTGDDTAALFAQATTPTEVEMIRLAQIQRLEQQQRQTTGGSAAFAMVMAAVNTRAAQRLDALGGDGAAPAGNGTGTSTASSGTFFDYTVAGKPWDAKTNPLVVPGLPAFVNNWLNKRLANGNANVQRMGTQTDLYLQAVLTALPGALFMLMPVFALVLRLAYAPRHIGYLEHLVVALYSHAWLMLVVLVTFCLVVPITTPATAQSWLASVSTLLCTGLWLAVPVYLLWMQQRIYGGNRLLTLLRYLAIGSVYLLLVSFVVMYAVLAGISA